MKRQIIIDDFKLRKMQYRQQLEAYQKQLKEYQSRLQVWIFETEFVLIDPLENKILQKS